MTCLKKEGKTIITKKKEPKKMIYSFTISESFLSEVASLEYNKTEKVLDFIEENFLYTDGLYLQVDRNILEQKYGDFSNDRIENFLKTLSRLTKDIFRERDIKADIGLVSRGEKILLNNILHYLISFQTRKRLKKN